MVDNISNGIIILALHDDGEVKKLFIDACGHYGHDTYVVPQVEYSILPDKIREIKPYGVIMDLNLESHNSLDIGPAKRAYEAAKPFVGNRFLGISGRRRTVEDALKEGMPVDHKPINFEAFKKRFFSEE